ncbi:unnamed protein product [Closterium sp. NIES-54]
MISPKEALFTGACSMVTAEEIPRAALTRAPPFTAVKTPPLPPLMVALVGFTGAFRHWIATDLTGRAAAVMSAAAVDAAPTVATTDLQSALAFTGAGAAVAANICPSHMEAMVDHLRFWPTCKAAVPNLGWSWVAPAPSLALEATLTPEVVAAVEVQQQPSHSEGSPMMKPAFGGCGSGERLSSYEHGSWVMALRLLNMLWMMMEKAWKGRCVIPGELEMQVHCLH